MSSEKSSENIVEICCAECGCTLVRCFVGDQAKRITTGMTEGFFFHRRIVCLGKIIEESYVCEPCAQRYGTDVHLD